MKYPFSDLLKYRSMKELDDQKQYGSKQMVQYKSLIEHSPFNKIILKNIRFNIITQNRIFFHISMDMEISSNFIKIEPKTNIPVPIANLR